MGTPPLPIAQTGSVWRWLAIAIAIVLLSLPIVAPLMGLAGFTNVQADPPPHTDSWFG